MSSIKNYVNHENLSSECSLSFCALKLKSSLDPSSEHVVDLDPRTAVEKSLAPILVQRGVHICG